MQLIRFFAATALLLSPVLLHAQEANQIMSVRVPFPFRARGVLMPAGRYDVMQSGFNRVWELRTFGHVAVEVPVTAGKLCKTPVSSALVFDHDARGYTLHEFLRSGQSDAAEVVEPARSRHQEEPGALLASVTLQAK